MKLWKNCSKKEQRAIANIQKLSDMNHQKYKEGLISITEYESTKLDLLDEVDRIEKLFNERSDNDKQCNTSRKTYKRSRN